jgi:hypothetical protein
VKQSWDNLGPILAFASRNWGTPRIASIPLEILTGLLPKPLMIDGLKIQCCEPEEHTASTLEAEMMG